jgi:hypothetical protein
MKILIILLGLVFAAVPTALSQSYQNGQYVIHKHLSREHIANGALAASVALSSIPADTMIAYIQAIGGDVYFRDDGNAATSSTSRYIPSGGSLSYSGVMSNLRFLSKSGAPELEIVYYGRMK